MGASNKDHTNMHLLENMGLSLIVLILGVIGAIAALGVTAWKGARPGILTCVASGVVIALVSLVMVLDWSHMGLIKPAAIPGAYLTVLANDLIVWLTVSAIGIGLGYGLYGIRTGAYKRAP